MLKHTGKEDFKTVRQAHKVEMYYEIAVQILELMPTEARAVPSLKRWDMRLPPEMISRRGKEGGVQLLLC